MKSARLQALPWLLGAALFATDEFASAGPPSSPSASPTASARASASSVASLPATGASAEAPPAKPDPTAAPSASASSAPSERAWASCVEYVPEGAVRPKVEAHFPPNGDSGHELRLVVVVTHGKGETVLPAGFRIERASDAMRAVEAAGFRLPDASSPSRALIDRPSHDDGGDAEKQTVSTTLSLPFLALPDKPGRHALRLPSLPIAVGRANGQLMTVCTPTMPITIEDPIANDPDPQVRQNAPPRSQREEWTLAKQLTLGALAVLALAALGAWLLYRWSKRPREATPQKRTPPWITALDELEAIRVSGLVEEGRLDVYVERVNACVRRYLGERFGFDGLESTTEEIRRLLERVPHHGLDRRAVEGLLDDTDLVKFAKFTPGPDDCAHVLTRAETIVRSTIPTTSMHDEEAA